MRLTKLFTLTLVFCFILLSTLQAQKKSSIFKDSLDGKLDLSEYVIHLHGFVPIPSIITEPALGNFGIALAGVFITPKKSLKEDKFRMPDITGGAGMYTLNNSWAVGALRQGSFTKIGMRYLVALAYTNLNLDFYRSFEYLGDKEFHFDMKPIITILDASENIWKNRLFAGFRYTFIYMDTKYNFQTNLDSIAFRQPNSTSRIGTLGIYAELDKRNSMFTPDKGIRVKATYTFGRSFTGSDYTINKGEVYCHLFVNPLSWLVSGIRTQWVGVNNDVPFYYYPFIELRGIPIMRYQGNQTLVLETEQRIDITKRWSLVGFVGTGKTFSASKYMQDNSWHWAGGTGFRYLVARLFKLRMGIDIAASKDQFAYYIIFGHYWTK